MRIDWLNFKTIRDSRKLDIIMVEQDGGYILSIQESALVYDCIIDKDGGSDQLDFEANYKSSCNPEKVSNPPFKSKEHHNFDGRGQSYTASASATTNMDFTVPNHATGYDFDGLTLIGTELGDTVTMKVLDDASGTYSGVPNYVLNQFATNWNTAKDKCSEMMPYPARLYSGMIIRIEYTNASVEKTIGMNARLHKVV